MQSWDAQIKKLVKDYSLVEGMSSHKSFTKKFNFVIKKMTKFDPVDSINFLAGYPVHCIPELTQACQKHILKEDPNRKVLLFMHIIYSTQEESIKRHYEKYFPQLIHFERL